MEGKGTIRIYRFDGKETAPYGPNFRTFDDAVAWMMENTFSFAEGDILTVVDVLAKFDVSLQIQEREL